jgi:hypothetical protein
LLLDRRHQSRKLRLGLIKIHCNHALKIKSDQTRSSLSFAKFGICKFPTEKAYPLEGGAQSAPIIPARQRGPIF